MAASISEALAKHFRRSPMQRWSTDFVCALHARRLTSVAVILRELVDVVGLAPGFCAALNGAGSEARSERVGGDIPSSGAVQGDAEVAEFQDTLGGDEHIARRDVTVDGAALVDPGDGTEQANDLATCPRFGPGRRITLEVASKVAMGDVLGDQAIEWSAVCLARDPCEGIVDPDDVRHMAKEMAEVGFAMPGQRVEGHFQDAGVGRPPCV
jgi:hypothetical protein